MILMFHDINHPERDIRELTCNFAIGSKDLVAAPAYSGRGTDGVRWRTPTWSGRRRRIMAI